MSKRSSPDADPEQSDGEESACNSQDGHDHEVPKKRKRLVEFEPVRLLAISGVDEIDSKVRLVQLYKLSERLRLKDRYLNEEKRKNETLQLRQDRDDTILCTINRHWNRIEEEFRNALDRTNGIVKSEPHDEKEDIKDKHAHTREFLSELAEMEVDDGDTLCEKRVQTSLRMMNEFMEMHQRFCLQQKDFGKQLLTAVGLESEDDKKSALSSLITNLEKAGEFSRLTSLVDKLTRENDSLTLKNREISLRAAKMEDRLSLSETKIEELQRAHEEKDFELRKSWEREEKLDYRLYKMAHERCDGIVTGERKQNGGVAKLESTVNVSNKELSDLQAEFEIQKDLAALRLDEIKELTDKVSKLAADNTLLTMQQNTVSSEAIMKSEEFIGLQTVYSVLLDQYQNMGKELEVAKSSAAMLKTTQISVVEHFKHDKEVDHNRSLEQIQKLETELNKVKSDYEMLRIDYELNLAKKENEKASQGEYKTIISSLKTQNHNLKNESAKFKKKWKDAVNNLQKTHRELEHERRLREQSICIRVEDEEQNELASPDHQAAIDHHNEETLNGVENEHIPTGSAEVEAYVGRLRTRIVDLKSKLSALTSLSTDERDRLEIMAKERRLRLENDRLSTTIRKIGCADRREKMKFYSDDAIRKITQLEDANSRLRADAENSKSEEETLMNEMESTGQAFEELQEQNAKLLLQLKEKDDQNFKMMSDRIITSQLQKKLKEEKDTMEELILTLRNTIGAQAQEISTYKETQKKEKQLMEKKDMEDAILGTQLSQYTSKSLEQMKTNIEVQTRVEKLNAQLKEAQEAVKAKTRAHETDMSAIRRLEEDKTNLKRRLERAKKTEQYGSSDAVYMEEIKDLKESLTCPSCKVNRKDGVLTKCFHVFCMKCLKTRYDTRRRKCPKCNAGFGANDFHRLYFA